MHSYICSRISNEEDILDVEQDVLLNIWKARNSFRGDSSFLTWARRIADNRIADFHRERYRRHEKELTAGIVWLEKKKRDGLVEDIIPRIYVNQLLERETPIARYILKHREDGDSFVEIADALRLSYEATRSQYRRAKKRIQKRAAADLH